MDKTDLSPFDPESHAKLTKRVDHDFGRFIERFLSKTPPCQCREALRLIADDCYARMEKPEAAASKSYEKTNNAPN